MLSADRIRTCLEGSTLPSNPAVIDATQLQVFPDALKKRFDTDLKVAGVLIPVVQRQVEPTVLLTRRSAALAHHAGQVSFPGGRMEPDDRDIVHTALRETHEEVGIVADAIEVVGCLPSMPTVTGYAVTPVVGLVDNVSRLLLDPMEVAVAFEVPLRFLLDRRNEHWGKRTIDGHDVPVVEFRYGGERIWGATASMLLAFRSALGLRDNEVNR